MIARPRRGLSAATSTLLRMPEGPVKPEEKLPTPILISGNDLAYRLDGWRGTTLQELSSCGSTADESLSL
jgi:hypothetical protein